MVRKFTESLVREMVEVETGNEYALIHLETTGKLDENTGKVKKRKITLSHTTCGHIYSVPLYEFTDGKRRCAKCKGKVLREHFAEKLKSIQGKTTDITDGEYSFVDDHYVNSKHKHRFEHNTCETVFTKKWDKFKVGQRCPNCQRKGMESFASLFTRDIFDYFKIEYDSEKRFKLCTNPKTGMVLPFDYYLKKINTIIEIDGEQHERGSFNRYDGEGTRKRDKIKNKFAEDNGITLIRIPAKKWSQLPEILHVILSEKLLPSLTLKQVKSVPRSSRTERVSKDLQKFHNAEYHLHDLYYFGTDRIHQYKHNICDTVFPHTLTRLKDEKYPCPACRDAHIKKDNHPRLKKKLQEKSKGRYLLDDSKICIDDKGRRLVLCTTCQNKWYVTIANLMADKAGCPHCLKAKKDKEWKEKYNQIISVIQNSKKLSKSQKHWLWHNQKRYKLNKLQEERRTLLHTLTLLVDEIESKDDLC